MPHTKYCALLKASYIRHTLHYLKPARTSRGEMQTHSAYYLCLQKNNRKGYGEAAPLPGLSIDHIDGFELKLKQSCQAINDGMPLEALDLESFPALQFAFETAYLSLQHEEEFVLYETDFLRGKGIPINGLVWMDTKEEMLKQAYGKIEKGFDCIKFKVGALDFDEECRMLEALRRHYSAFKVEIRLDANGAFTPSDALEKLKELSRFEIHSIEQPIKQGQYDWMQEICSRSLIDVALDEELIGLHVEGQGLSMLRTLKPKYIILKPTLIGGLNKADRWIEHAERLDIDWWATSALESNIGLNAIAQWVSAKDIKMPQGLGTGSLYTNNITSPLEVKNGSLYYQAAKGWQNPETLAEDTSI